MTIKSRILEIKSLKKDECWYITKQTLKFNELCWAGQIAENFQLEKPNVNFEDYFNSNASKFGITANHRMTNNCYYLGLLKNNGNYKDATTTEAYAEIKLRCKGDFNNTATYEDLIIKQIEKIFISHPVDTEHNGLRKNYTIYPALFLSKVLILIGEQTGNYSISLSEFYKFVGTSYRYEYYLSTVTLILESRENNNLTTDLNYIDEYYNDIQNITIDNFVNNRIHLLLANLPYFEISGSSISIVTSYINELKKKLLYYENSNNINLLSAEFLYSSNGFFQTAEEPLKQNKYNTKSEKYNLILYGSPGTGKSHKIAKITNGHSVIRTTFHPETDYYSFIGSYKPRMNGSQIEYSFTPQSFTKAYCEAWKNPATHLFLVIEEINRGNCAQIFGDIFQCLERNTEGYSTYEIEIDYDLSKFLKSYFESNLSINQIEYYNSKTGSNVGEFNKLRLPPNLFFYATMNTSDQSLFAMDSAFKRRWEWEYIPIDYSDASNLIIKINNNKSYNYGNFITIINQKIIEITGSEDKQLGNRFISPESGIINFEIFRSKIMYYLWSEIFKNESDTPNTIFKINNDLEFNFGDLFKNQFHGLSEEMIVVEFMKYNGVEPIENSHDNSI